MSDRRGFFGGAFDFDRDGKLDSVEQAMEWEFIREMQESGDDAAYNPFSDGDPFSDDDDDDDDDNFFGDDDDLFGGDDDDDLFGDDDF